MKQLLRILRKVVHLKLYQAHLWLIGPLIVSSVRVHRTVLDTDDGPFIYEFGEFYIVPRNLRWLKPKRNYCFGMRVIDIPSHFKQNRGIVIATLRNTINHGLAIVAGLYASDDPYEFMKRETTK